jgi:hypothetical protein
MAAFKGKEMPISDEIAPMVQLSITSGLTSSSQLIDSTSDEMFSFGATTAGFEELQSVIVPTFEAEDFEPEALPLAPELYTPERKAEFLLSNAIDAEDYARAIEEVKKMGLDPDMVPHRKPVGV